VDDGELFLSSSIAFLYLVTPSLGYLVTPGGKPMERWVYPTTGLKQEDFEEGRVRTTWSPIRGEYAWDAGVAVGRFLAELKAGRIVGRRCRVCRRVMVPPRMFCEQCFRPTDEWVPLQDTGTVVTFSVCTVSWDMRRLEVPEVPAVIALDGASPGMGILHKIGEVGQTMDEILRRVQVGLRVQAVWKPPHEREGAITDILYFRPVQP
jgi:hypothetical protein